MTRNGRELLVERFVGCEMNVAEEREFIMQAAVDPDLFQMLRAYRLMDQALQQNRDRVTMAFPLIDISTVAVPAAVSPAPPQTPGVPSGSGWRAFLGGGIARGVAVTLVAACAGFILRPVVYPAEPVVAERNIQTPAPVIAAPVATQPVAKPLEVTNSAPVENVSTGADEISRPVARRYSPALRTLSDRNRTSPSRAASARSSRNKNIPSATARTQHNTLPSLGLPSDTINGSSQIQQIKMKATIILPSKK